MTTIIKASRLITYPCIGLFIVMLFAALLPTIAGEPTMGPRTACKSNLKEFLKMINLYGQNFDRGTPMESADANGTANLKALLWGTWNGTNRSPADAVLRSPKLFLCPSDDDVEKGEGDLNMLRNTATMKDFHRYTSYVLAANNLTHPGPDQIVMADDAEDGLTGNFYDNGIIRSADAHADGSGSPGFNFYGKTPPFYTHLEKDEPWFRKRKIMGVVILGDYSTLFVKETDGVSKLMWKGNPKSDASLSCYY